LLLVIDRGWAGHSAVYHLRIEGAAAGRSAVLLAAALGRSPVLQPTL
jgi:hypothetical protein